MANGAELATAYLAIGDAVGTISERYYFAGRLSEGLRVIGHGLALAEAQEAPVGMRAGLLVQEGKLRSLENFQGLGDFDQTLDVLERARQTAVDANSRQLEADAVDLTGMTHYYRALAQGGEYDAARELFERALEMRAQLDDSRGLAETEFHIGLIHQNTGRWPEARQWFERAIDRARSDGHKLELSYAVRHLGFV